MQSHNIIHVNQEEVIRTLEEISGLSEHELGLFLQNFHSVLESLEIYPGFPKIQLDCAGKIKNYEELKACYYHFVKHRTLYPIVKSENEL